MGRARYRLHPLSPPPGEGRGEGIEQVHASHLKIYHYPVKNAVEFTGFKSVFQLPALNFADRRSADLFRGIGNMGYRDRNKTTEDTPPKGTDKILGKLDLKDHFISGLQSELP